MAIELNDAASFLARHGRLLDRRRFELLLGRGSPEAVLAALDGYRNPDGGYGWCPVRLIRSHSRRLEW